MGCGIGATTTTLSEDPNAAYLSENVPNDFRFEVLSNFNDYVTVDFSNVAFDQIKKKFCFDYSIRITSSEIIDISLSLISPKGPSDNDRIYAGSRSTPRSVDDSYCTDEITSDQFYIVRASTHTTMMSRLTYGYDLFRFSAPSNSIVKQLTTDMNSTSSTMDWMIFDTNHFVEQAKLRITNVATNSLFYSAEWNAASDDYDCLNDTCIHFNYPFSERPAFQKGVVYRVELLVSGFNGLETLTDYPIYVIEDVLAN
jgi:hypothetical protein